MTTVHILTMGFASPNGIAFLFPLYVHRRRLAETGVQFRSFGRLAADVVACDVLIVDSRFYSARWAREASAALDELNSLAEQVATLLYFDISDSTGWLQTQVLPIVSRYYKAQLLKDRQLYLASHYGNRIYADYYHREFGVEDGDPVASQPVERLEDLTKLRISWNSGLANYSLWGPTIMAMRQHLPFDGLLRYPRRFTPPRRRRRIAVACRFGTDYSRATVAYQRRRIRETLSRRVATDKLSRRAYIAEMRDCQVVVSPFGFGEITLKDFEALICGALSFKPDMSHVETWPDFFRDRETMVTHRWDLDDLDEALDNVLGDEDERQAITERGQLLYRHHIASESGHEAFCQRFHDIVSDSLAQ